MSFLKADENPVYRFINHNDDDDVDATNNSNNRSVYAGSVMCCSPGCSSKAYYSMPTSQMQLIRTTRNYFCGVHSRKMITRTELPKEPARLKDANRQNKQAQDAIAIERVRMENFTHNQRGRVIVSKLRMMKLPDDHVGFVKVFPNNRHQNRADGFGCCSLSPMRLGPVDHGQPTLPRAKNIENFHQGSKCFEEELDPKTREPTALYYNNRLTFYNDDTPHRHKYQSTGKNKNIPVFFGWIDRDSKLCRLSYIESRQFYCTFYERLTTGNADLATLRALLDGGTNLQIVGYDARPIESTKEAIEHAYLDASAPFGHELVLFTLLVLTDPNDYPWRKYKTFMF